MGRYWTPPEDPGQTQRVLIDLLSVLSRVLPAACFGITSYIFWNSFMQNGKWTSLMWMVSEGLVVLLLVFRRDSLRLSSIPWDWIAALGGTFAVLLVRPATSVIVFESAGIVLQIMGTLFAIYGKVSLGRSFGLVAADRGIVSEGPYRIVRHPSTSDTSSPTSDSFWPTGAPATSPSTFSSIFSRFRGFWQRSGFSRRTPCTGIIVDASASA